MKTFDEAMGSVMCEISVECQQPSAEMNEANERHRSILEEVSQSPKFQRYLILVCNLAVDHGVRCALASAFMAGLTAGIEMERQELSGVLS